MGGRDEAVENALMKVMGLERWFAGRNSIQTSSGRQDLWVDHLWILFGTPSFHGWWYLAGVDATTEKTKTPVGRVAWVPETDVHRHAEHLTSDGVAGDVSAVEFVAAVNSVQLLGVESRILSLDGIGYWFSVWGCDATGGFRFGNPRRHDLIAIERAAFDLGQRLQQATGSAALRECLEVWDGYRVKDRGD
jgi:hypothetical protein